jgi:hypothetical protein
MNPPEPGSDPDREDAANVILELDDSLAMILLGLEALESRGGRPRSLDAAMQNLAAGFEHLMKLTYILASDHVRGTRPSRAEIKRIGHDLITLMDALLASVDGVDAYVGRPAVIEDLAFMREDDAMRNLLATLASFGNAGRYSRLDDMVSARRQGADDEPSRRWEEIEQELVWSRPDVDDIAESTDLLSPATFEVRRRLQRLGRAIARMWILGALGETGAIHYGALSILARLDDEELGLGLGTG